MSKVGSSSSLVARNLMITKMTSAINSSRSTTSMRVRAPPHSSSVGWAAEKDACDGGDAAAGAGCCDGGGTGCWAGGDWVAGSGDGDGMGLREGRTPLGESGCCRTRSVRKGWCLANRARVWASGGTTRWTEVGSVRSGAGGAGGAKEKRSEKQVRKRASAKRKSEKGERVRRRSWSSETERESQSKEASGRPGGERPAGGDGAIAGRRDGRGDGGRRAGGWVNDDGAQWGGWRL